MILGMDTPEESEDGDEELLIHLSWCAGAWTRTARTMLAAERAAAMQPDPPPPPGVVPIRRAKGEGA
jgi:hypothetical protein